MWSCRRIICAQPYIQLAKELDTDTRLVDTFLHPQDRAYTVPQVFDLLNSTDLEFQNCSTAPRIAQPHLGAGHSRSSSRPPAAQ